MVSQSFYGTHLVVSITFIKYNDLYVFSNIWIQGAFKLLGRPESHISLILDYQFCACVIRTSGVPQLRVIHIERLYGYK